MRQFSGLPHINWPQFEPQPAVVRDAPRGGGTVVVSHQLWLDGFLPLGGGAADPANLDPPASDRLCDQHCCDAVLHRMALGGHVACSFCHRPCLCSHVPSRVRSFDAGLEGRGNRVFRHRSVHDAGAELARCNFPQIGDDLCALCNSLGTTGAKDTA